MNPDEIIKMALIHDGWIGDDGKPTTVFHIKRPEWVTMALTYLKLLPEEK